MNKTISTVNAFKISTSAIAQNSRIYTNHS